MEMHVHDPRRYRGDGVIRVYLTDDACRIPVRIESSVPGVGSFVLTIESYAEPAPACAASHTGGQFNAVQQK
jgi:predicted secreted protein